MEAITNRQLYDRALARFNVEIRQSGRGYVVLVIDDNGNPMRFPIRLSEFQERPRFYAVSKLEEKLQQPKPLIDRFQLGQVVRDLNRLVDSSRVSSSKEKLKFHKKKKHKSRRY